MRTIACEKCGVKIANLAWHGIEAFLGRSLCVRCNHPAFGHALGVA